MHIPSKYLRPSRIDATHKSVIICISSPNSVITLKMHTDPEHFRDKARGHRPRLQFISHIDSMSLLFPSDPPCPREQLEDGAVLLRGFASAKAPLLIQEVERIAQLAAFRHLTTPGGYGMSVAMTNCGRVGWVSDRTGYRYDPVDPQSGARWPAMPRLFLELAARAAAQ